MAERPIFRPSLNGPLLVTTQYVNFQWFAGMAKSQSQKSIESLHENAKNRLGLSKILEISSKSKDDLGVQLSAFNLMITTRQGRQFSLECAYQASKVFEHGGPFVDMFGMRSIDAKRDPRLNESGRLIRFHFFGTDWPLLPRTAFYDWLYINALHKHPELVKEVLTYSAFTDIAFNPVRSINCQAYAAALYISLHARGLLNDSILKDQAAYLDIINTVQVNNAHENTFTQDRLIE